MSTQTYVYSTTLTVIDCPTCGCPFAIPNDLDAARRRDGGNFCCPQSHSMSYDSEIERLKRELKGERDRLAAVRARADGAEASLRATKGHVTRLRRQVLAGECPLCGQHLRDLARHISRQHPDEPAEAPA